MTASRLARSRAKTAPGVDINIIVTHSCAATGRTRPPCPPDPLPRHPIPAYFCGISMKALWRRGFTAGSHLETAGLSTEAGGELRYVSDAAVAAGRRRPLNSWSLTPCSRSGLHWAAPPPAAYRCRADIAGDRGVGRRPRPFTPLQNVVTVRSNDCFSSARRVTAVIDSALNS